MKNELLLKAGGVFHMICAILHGFFPKMLDWKNALIPLDDAVRPIINANLQIMNLCLLIFWVIFALIPLFYTREMLTTNLGKLFLKSIVVFWVIRIAVLQPLFIGLDSAVSWKMIGFFMIGLVLFSIPLMRQKR